MNCCGSKNRTKYQQQEKREMEVLLISTMFSETEIRELKKQFMLMSKNTGYLTMI